MQDSSLATSSSSNFCSQAPAYARLTKSAALTSGSINNKVVNELADDSGLLVLLPVSAESAGLLPKRRGKNTLYKFSYHNMFAGQHIAFCP